MRRLWFSERESEREGDLGQRRAPTNMYYALLCCVVCFICCFFISNKKSTTHAHYRKMPPLCNSSVSEKRENACFVWVEFCVCVFFYFNFWTYCAKGEWVVESKREWERVKHPGVVAQLLANCSNPPSLSLSLSLT